MSYRTERIRMIAPSEPEHFREATERIAEMGNDELGDWYAAAVHRYALLSLWHRRSHKGDTSQSACDRRDEMASAAADLILAVSEILDAELLYGTGLRPNERPRQLVVHAELVRDHVAMSHGAGMIRA